MTAPTHRRTHSYTPAQIAFIAANVKGRTFAELTEMFNREFGTSLRRNQVASTAGNKNLCNGLSGGQFKKGQVSWNKGRKGIHLSPETEFKKGQMPHNNLPVGTETVRVDGYTWVKIAEPNNWKEKHRLLWEAAHGNVPPGHIVTFADGDTQNLSLDNLILITRAQNSVLNHLGLRFNDAELTKTGILIADVKLAAAKRVKGERKVTL